MIRTTEVAGQASGGGGLERLYRLHGPDAVRLAYLLTGDAHLAEDLTQDAFVRVIGRFHHIRNIDTFGFYLRRAVVNLSRSHFRRLQVERAHARRTRADLATHPPDVEARERMKQALLALPDRQRAAVVLRFYEDLSEADTAEILGCPVGTVKSLVSRGLERLRRDLAEDG